MKLNENLTARAEAALRELGKAIEALGHQVEVVEQVAKKVDLDDAGNFTLIPKKYKLLIEGHPAEVRIAEYTKRGYYYSTPPTGLLELTLSGVREEKRYATVKNTRRWHEEKAGAAIKAIPFAKAAPVVAEYTKLAAEYRAEYRKEINAEEHWHGVLAELHEKYHLGAKERERGVSIRSGASGIRLEVAATTNMKLLEAILRVVCEEPCA